MHFIKILLILIIILITHNLALASPEERLIAVQSFVDEMAKKHGFERDALMNIMRQAQFQNKIIKAITKPAESKPWYEYREIFLTSARIDGGLRFWRANETILRRVANEYGVPPEIIIAIIGVETRYGKIMGNYKVLDALATLAFGYPKRGEFFKQELEALLLLNREEKIDFINCIGSYAGAMGMPQFMPSSYRAHAVDQDGDGKRDLWNSTADIIGSVANYFHNYGWKNGEQIVLRASGITNPPQIPIESIAKPQISLSTLTAQGIITNPPLTNEPTAATTLASLIHLDGDTGNEYWIGFNNFYVITRYNRSNLYAMAVYQLSQEILALHGNTISYKK